MVRNKKANIPVTILVVGVLAVCGLAIFSFYLGNERIVKDISDISVIEKVKVEKEKLDFYVNELGFSESEVGEMLDVNFDGENRFLTAQKGDVTVIYNIP